MPKYGVVVTFSESAYCEVEADNEEDAIEKAQTKVDNNDLEPYGGDDIEFEVEEINEET